MSDDPWIAEQQVRALHEYVEKDRHLFLRQKNPLYAWNAIAHLLARDMPLPSWCANYLKNCALAIDGLSKEVAQANWDGDLDSGLQKAPNNGRKPEEAMRAIPAALDFATGKGKNAFAELKSDVAHMQDAALIEFTDEPRKAKKKIAARRGVDVERGVGHRIQRGRKLLNSNDGI